jgi:Holliday junction DNA helicase RuvA
MIQFIKGILVHKTPVSAVVETPMGLGFELRIPVSTFEVLPAEGQSCFLFTFLHIGQDDIRLFGFATEAECELYQMLNRIGGIGPKIALSILSTLTIPAFVRAVEQNQTALITKVPGIGAKSAQRLVIELKDRIHHLAERFEPSDQVVGESVILEVETALQSLGFNPRDVRRELGLLPSEAANLGAEELIKEVIKRLYQRNR